MKECGEISGKEQWARSRTNKHLSGRSNAECICDSSNFFLDVSLNSERYIFKLMAISSPFWIMHINVRDGSVGDRCHKRIHMWQGSTRKVDMLILIDILMSEPSALHQTAIQLLATTEGLFYIIYLPISTLCKKVVIYMCEKVSVIHLPLLHATLILS